MFADFESMTQRDRAQKDRFPVLLNTLFQKWFDSQPSPMARQKKGSQNCDPFSIGNFRLETTEATKLAHVKLLNLNTGGNLEHSRINCLLLELLAG